MGLMNDRTTKEKLFFVIRIFLIAFGFVTNLVTVQSVPDAHVPNPLIFFVVIPIMVLLVLGVQFINPSSGSTWYAPSWWVNPFSFSQPYQFCHLAFYFFLAGGVGTSISSIYSSSSLKFGLCLVAIGLSGVASIKLSQYVFTRKNP